MARKIVTIITRRGNSSDFDESKMLAGEIATAEDTEQAYISFSDGTAEELALKRDIHSENIPNIPTALPNPYSLTFSGAVVAEYDGSSAVNVRIPTGDGSGGDSNVVIPADEQLSEDTLLVINPDATPDKIPQWYNGTAVTAVGQTTVSGSAAGDYYINTATFDVYHATAPDTWAYVGNIKGGNGSAGIFFGAYDGSDGQPPEDAVLWIDPNEAANTDFITADGLVTAMSNADYSNVYSVNDTGGISVKIGPIRIETGYESMKCSTANSPVSKQVYFQHPFSLTPKIITHAALSDPKQGSCGRSNADETGFALTFVRSSTAACGCNWFAIGLA